MTPDSTGESTQESTMPPRPPFIFQFKQPHPTATHVAPTDPPMMACVVDTGIHVVEASRRKTAAEKSDANIAMAYRDMALLQ
mmetsp:Transcript_10600/g.26871  ORF Transcript_10600/g.26871 Transcript_10600/m.26871 type:complete len:82 (-) Transcript_10600:599-844(-)